MSALVWLTIPVVALVLAMLWVAWASRTPPRADVHETVEAHRRFVAALDAHPGARRTETAAAARVRHRSSA